MNISVFERLFNFVQNDIQECSENICVIIFYYIFCTSSVEKNIIFEFDLSAFENILNKNSLNNFSNENRLLNAINNNDLSLIKNFDVSLFNGVYGKKECNLIYVYFSFIN